MGRGGGSKAVWEFSKKTSTFENLYVPKLTWAINYSLTVDRIAFPQNCSPSQFEAPILIGSYILQMQKIRRRKGVLLGDGLQWLVELISIGGSTEVGTAAAAPAAAAADHCRCCRERGPCALLGQGRHPIAAQIHCSLH